MRKIPLKSVTNFNYSSFIIRCSRRCYGYWNWDLKAVRNAIYTKNQNYIGLTFDSNIIKSETIKSGTRSHFLEVADLKVPPHPPPLHWRFLMKLRFTETELRSVLKRTCILFWLVNRWTHIIFKYKLLSGKFFRLCFQELCHDSRWYVSYKYR